MAITIKYPHGARSGIAKHLFESKVRETVEMQGSLHAYESQSNANEEEMRLIVEFDNIERVPRAVQRLNGIRVDVSHVSLKAVNDY
jgi:hypothetical protein